MRKTMRKMVFEVVEKPNGDNVLAEIEAADREGAMTQLPTLRVNRFLPYPLEKLTVRLKE